MALAFLIFVALLGVHVVAAVVATSVIARRIERANPPGGTFVRVDGGRLHVYDSKPWFYGDKPWSPEKGPAILLLHGATSNARDMVVALAGPLSEHRRVIAIDRPGHGWSDRPRGSADASPARQADLIAQALGGLGVDRVVVVGHSLAGAVATSLALDHKENVAGLVLLSAVTHSWPGGIAWYYRLAATPVLGRLFVNTIMTPIGAWGLETASSGSFTPSEGPADYAEATSAALVLRPDEFRWNGQDVAALKAFVTRQAPRYHEIDMPCAIIASAEDHVVSTDIHARSIARQIEGSRLTVLRGMGHQVHYAARDIVIAEIERVASESALYDPGSRKPRACRQGPGGKAPQT
jgi:pimeloyl-ACP methyl ester carboxylesterase